MKRFSLSKIFCCCTLGLLLSCSAWAQNPQMARSQALQELEKKGVSEQELQDELKSRGIEIDALQDLSPEEALRMQDEIAAAVEAIEQRKKSRKQAPSAVDQGSKPLEAMDPVMDAGAKGDTSKLTRDSTEFKSSTSKPVADSTAIWGQHIFDEKNLPVYRQGQQIKPPQSYILGAGDRITVSIWGLSQLNEIYEIQDDGYIAPERMPRIFLKGQSLARAKAALKNYFKRYYRFQDNQFDMVLNESRTVNINVFGEVRSPGGYTLPAINTAFNALVAAGGPNPIGSVRRIKLIRNGKASTLDVYKFMQDPTSQKDVYLEHNDILQIPVAEKVVRIEGAVNRPSQYELLPKEDLNKLISWAGGLKDLAIRKTIQIERYQKDRKIILDVPYEELTAKGGDFLLKSGDRVVVFAVRTKAENHVRVMGEVRTEAYYEHRAGMKLSELVAKIEFTPESNLQFAFIKRKNPNLSYSLLRVDLDRLLKGAAEADLELLPYDELTIYKQAVYADPSFVVVNGAVRNPGVFEVFPKQDIRIKDLVLLAGGLKPDAFEFAFLFRSRNNNQKDAEIIRVGIRDVMEQPSTDQNIYVEPYDSLVVLSKSNFEDDRYVEVSGAVKAPGRYA
ncbi:MAG TPA: SLBB domain-containing protein, partial [Saprospiraceae bacterium]|nr:SLBB domain-containing protein [Saprospiraceae bacterium]